VPNGVLQRETAARAGIGPGRGPGGGRLPALGQVTIICPVPACHASIDPSRLMCRPDWKRVPWIIQSQVWARRSGTAARSPEHQHAVRAAITAAGTSPDRAGAAPPSPVRLISAARPA
jgi:hypothetical protein